MLPDEVREAVEAIARKAFAFDAMVAAGRISQELADESLALTDGPIELLDTAALRSYLDAQSRRVERYEALLRETTPYLRDEAANYEDDGSNEPLELVRRIEDALTAHLSENSRG